MIGQDNSSLQTMSTDQLLDLFRLDDRAQRTGAEHSAQECLPLSGKRSSMRAMLDSLEELWDEKQYESEYSLDNFIKTLTK